MTTDKPNPKPSRLAVVGASATIAALVAFRFALLFGWFWIGRRFGLPEMGALALGAAWMVAYQTWLAHVLLKAL